MRGFPRSFGGPIVEAALAPASPQVTAAAAVVRSQVGLQSPMAPDPNHLESVVWADLTGQDVRPLDRTGVMTIPAVARQRHLICGVVARCTLRTVDAADVPTPTQPRWMTTGRGMLSAYHRMLWTADDLIFGPFSVWYLEREAPDQEAPILAAERVPTTDWEVDEDSRLIVMGRQVADWEVIVIPGPHEGICTFGAPALRRTIDNLDAAATAARNPSAYLELHYTGTEPLTPEDKETLLTDWAAARRGERGGVAFTGPNLEVKEHGTHEAHLLIEGRNADAVDVSRMVSSPAAMADATAAGASLSYETTEGRGLQFLDYGASLYMDSIAARLSMDDVVAPGLRTTFDVSNATTFTPTPGTGQEA